MGDLTRTWEGLDTRKRAIVGLATIAVFAIVLFLARGTGSKDMALLYSGLESAAAGEVVTALDQRGVVYEVRGTAVYVEAAQRDLLRMSLAGEGLPQNSTQGYEILDQLSGFGTTSQMFDAAYWRAKEGELARTILASPFVRSARVHISSPTNRPFARDQRPTAAVTVTPQGGALSPDQAKALQFLVSSAVSGLTPDDVAVIDSTSGLVSGSDASAVSSGGDRADGLRLRAQRLLEARVGFGNAMVEVSVDTVTETESITQRTIDPDSRIAISTEVEERTNTAQDSGDGAVTVASNLPTGDASGVGNSSNSENSETRSLTNYEVSETQREVLRVPGAIRRLSVAVLVNDVVTTAADGTVTSTPRTPEELEALKTLVASAVGLDEARGDVLTLQSMAFEPVPSLGTTAAEAVKTPLNLMSLIQIGVLAFVVLVLGLFVVRPILTGARSARLPPPQPTLALDNSRPAGTMAISGGTGTQMALSGPASTAQDAPTDDAEPAEDPVARLRRMIAERQTESIQLLQSWIEDPDDREKA